MRPIRLLALGLALLSSALAQPTPTPTNAPLSVNKTSGTVAGNSFNAATFRTANDIPSATTTSTALSAKPGVDAARYGASPSASASTNVTAINTALAAGGTVYVSAPGTYDVNASLIIPSRTTIIFAPGVILRKTAAYDHVIVNAGAFTRTWTEDIAIVGLHIDVNGNENRTWSAAFALQGQVALYYVRRATVEGLRCTTIGTSQYLLHAVRYEGLTVRDAYGVGQKTVAQFETGRDLVLQNIRGSVVDDLVALNAHDWDIAAGELGDIENVVAENLIDEPIDGQVGYTMRLLTGSWAAWQSGNSYLRGDTVVNAGKLYRKTNTGTVTASVAPTHAVGTFATGADGIEWYCMQVGTHTTANIRNVTVRNVVSTANRRIFDIPARNTDEQRSVYPGTENTAMVDGLTVSRLDYRQAVPETFAIIGLAGRVRNAVMRDITLSSTSLPKALVEISWNAIVDDFTFHKLTVPTWRASGSLLRVASGTPVVRNIVFSDCSITGKHSGSSIQSGDGLIATDTSNSIERLVIANSFFDYTPSLFQATTTNASIAFTGCTFASPERIIYVPASATTSTPTVQFTGCLFGTPSVALLGNDKAGTTLTARIVGSRLVSGSVVASSAGAVRLPECAIPVDTSRLTPTAGDIVVDSVTGLRVMYSGGAWGALVTRAGAQTFDQVTVGNTSPNTTGQLVVVHDSATRDAFAAIDTNSTNPRTWAFGPGNTNAKTFSLRDNTGSQTIWQAYSTADAGGARMRFRVPVVVNGDTTPLLTTQTAIASGAAAQTATLTNAPVSGNPTKWIAINDAGTTRYIPVW